MAASLVGGALLSSFLNVVFDRLSSPEVVNWIRGKKLDQRLLRRLETSLSVVQAVLNDAEQKQITDPAVKKWLTNLEDAVYEADDLLDEIHTKAAVTQKHPGKRFLVVLDDMWNESYDDWRAFQNPFQYGSEGSKILVTTRNDKVAYVVQTMQPYKLSLLSDEYCWSVFAKHASLSPDSREYSSLEEVGRKIVEKCKGLPLAAQTLGALLRTKDNVRDWKDILNSEIWEFSENESRILPALRISYHYLPSYLKRCFVFCSLYSKDYQFDRDELILLWMANDLLQSSKSCSTLVEIGYKNFNDLASRSFFQPSNIDERLFVMHDLAIFYAGDFYFRASELGSAAKVDIKTRHLSYDAEDNYSVAEFLKACDSLKYVRTLLLFNCSTGVFWSSREIALNISILQLKCIRVLSSVDFPLNSLPDSIGELIHLRYLDLSGAFIVILPESVSKLHNLQTLKLRNCRRLNMLPSNMKDLVNLRHLDIRGTHLQEMPIGMSKLKALHFLSDYIVGGCDENGIKELGALANLHGSLAIHKLETVLNSGEASEARMIDKLHIDYLEFNWSSRYNIAADFQNEKDILDKLQPCTELKVIKIECYMGEILSEWLGHSSYHSMTTLTLRRCRNCCKLPSLGQLPHLKHLEISHFDKLISIGAEFYKNDEFCQETPFPSLETLNVHFLPEWQVWHSSQFDGAFPQLKKLSIKGCSVLRGDLPNHLPALEELDIGGCEQLDCSLPSAPSMFDLDICGVSEVRFQELPSLRSLSISECSSAISFPGLPSLRSLSIFECSSAISFPGACIPASLQDLEIRKCKNLEFPMQQQRQQESLHRLEIHNSCDSLISFPLAAFPNLTYLAIGGACDSVKSFPGEGCLPASLETLELWNFPRLETLDCKGLLHLTSLQRLSIFDCPKLENIVGEKMPASLEELNIFYSPLLGERCRDKDPPIWPKISHIPRILVDGGRIHDLRSSSDADTYTNAADINSDTEGRKGQTLGCKGYFKCLRM